MADGGQELDRVRAELYGAPPGGFVAARDAAVAAARAAGDRPLATAIGKLRRPTQAAWLANLLAREEAAALEEFLSLGAELVAAQQGLEGEELRRLSTQRHRVVAGLVATARRIAAAAGSPVPDEAGQELAGTLDAALADPQVAVALRSGTMTTSASYAGWGPAPGAASASAPAAPKAATTGAGATGSAGPGAAGTADAPDGSLDARRRAAAARTAEREAAEKAAGAAEGAAAQAADDAAAAEDAAAAAERDLGAARLAAADAARRVADLEDQLAVARDAETAASEAENAAQEVLDTASVRAQEAREEAEDLQAQAAELRRAVPRRPGR